MTAGEVRCLIFHLTKPHLPEFSPSNKAIFHRSLGFCNAISQLDSKTENSPIRPLWPSTLLSSYANVFVGPAGLCVCIFFFFVLFCFKLQCKKHEALATVRHSFMQKPWWILKMLCFDWKEVNSGLSCQSGPNWGIVLDFNLSPVHSACAKHNTAPGFFQCRPGKQLWMKSGRGSGALPFDKHSSMK